MKIPKGGFTLIELSIVLIIVGLLVGSVLSGRELILNAQIQKTIRQKDEFDAAANTFKAKYNCLPGDCANATDYGFQRNGDGNDYITYTAGGDEKASFWQQLAAANLIAGSYTVTGGIAERAGQNASPAIPLPNKYKSGWSFWCENGGLLPPLGGNNYAITSNYIVLNDKTQGALSPELAQRIDGKIDDGIASSGSVKGFEVGIFVSDCDNSGTPPYTTGRPGYDVNQYCLSSGNYNILTSTANDAQRCVMSIKAAF